MRNQRDLVEHTLTLKNGQAGSYYVYPKNKHKFDRVLVYIHGLISDVRWFEVPDNLPKNTGILFLERCPRTHIDSFETWTENYEACFRHFKQSVQCDYFHLMGHCFGALPALHWAAKKPENFATLTLVSPPYELKHDFDLKNKLSIFFGKKDALKRCLLTPRSFSREPRLMHFIENNPTTTFEFSNAFFLEISRILGWIKKNVIAYPVPVHYVLSSEDEVIRHRYSGVNGHIKDNPDQVSLIYSDHYSELTANKNEFWDAVFKFQLQHESKLMLHGKIKTVLVTGATGFLGSHIARKLAQSGKKVIVFARDTSKAAAMFPENGNSVEFRQGQLNDLESIERALKGVDAVVHAAAHVSDWASAETFNTANVEGTKNLLIIAHAQGIKQFIQISSLGVFGDTDQVNIDENNPYVLSTDNYSYSKIKAEIFVKKYCRANKIPFTVIRPGFIYGEGDNNFFPNLIKVLKSNRFKYIGSKENILNTVYVGNVAELVNAVIGNPKSLGETYNIADTDRVAIGKFIPRLAQAYHLPEPASIAPKKIAFAAASLLETVYRSLRLKHAPPITRKKVTFAGRSRSVNSNKAYDLMGRVPFSFEEGLRRTLESIRHDV